MKNLTLTILFILTTTFALANDKVDVKETNKQLRNKIGTLLGDYQDVLESNTETSIKFVINREGQIIVLSVDTNKESLESFIKMKLNYKQTKIKNVKFLETYTVPVKFVKNKF